MNAKYLAVSGYGWSGSGAVVDLLREFHGFDSFDFEFSMIWEPNGLIELENALVNSWDPIGHDVAIKNFIKYCRILDRKGGRFSQWGANISNKLSTDFAEETTRFICSLTDASYNGYTRLHDYHLSALSLVSKRIKRRLGIDVGKNMYLSRPTEEVFLLEVQTYLNRVFQEYIRRRNIETLILDQSIPVSNVAMSTRYFSDIKCIVVDRDPRDIYVDLVNRKALIGLDCVDGTRESTRRYIQWHKSLRQNQAELRELEGAKTILNLRFEDVVFRTGDTLKRISRFLNMEMKREVTAKYFDSSVSMNNIGLWNTSPHQTEIEYIHDELKDYCYET